MCILPGVNVFSQPYVDRVGRITLTVEDVDERRSLARVVHISGYLALRIVSTYVLSRVSGYDDDKREREREREIH